jgi:long-chain acyl-CoA synthetase
MQKENVTLFSGVPTMYWALLNHDSSKYDLAKIARNLRICNSGGASLPLEVLRGFEKKFNVLILEGYGLSETSPVASFNHLHRERKPGSIGIPIWGVEMKVVDENDHECPVGTAGEIVIRGHNIMKGYYKRPEATKEVMRNDWFHTGDVGKMDEDGYFYIVDRIKDMIIRGGFNVYPREVEEVLLTHPAISLAAVIGVPHEQHGEEIKAFVVLKTGANATPEEIIAWSKEIMAAYKYPRQVEFRETLPMNATGKILKTSLRAEG